MRPQARPTVRPQARPTVRPQARRGPIYRAQLDERSNVEFLLPFCKLLQNLAQTFPQQSLCGARVVHNRGGCVETHGCPAVQIVSRPTRVSTSGKGNPGGVHGVRKLLAEDLFPQRLILLVIECVKNEGNLGCVACTEKTIELRRTPGKLIHIGSRVTLRVRLGQTDGGNAVEPVRDDSGEQIAGAGFRTC